MQISSRFTIAVHVFIAINNFEDEYKVTSKFLAGSINVNPVIIRQIIGQLKNSGLIDSSQGSSGIKISKNPEEITLLDIFNSVNSLDDGKLFAFHENPSKECPVGRNIHNILDNKLEQAQLALENNLKNTTLIDLFNDAKVIINNDIK